MGLGGQRLLNRYRLRRSHDPWDDDGVHRCVHNRGDVLRGSVDRDPQDNAAISRHREPQPSGEQLIIYQVPVPPKTRPISRVQSLIRRARERMSKTRPDVGRNP